MLQPPSQLHRLFYRSHQTPLVKGRLGIVVQDIIGSAIPRNRSVGITGRLLVAEGYFIQALEGGVDAVRTTFARISRDPRHSDVHIISQGAAEHRLFGEWDMCASTLSPSDDAILSVLGRNSHFKPRALNAASVQRLLVTVADIQRRTSSPALLL